MESHKPKIIALWGKGSRGKTHTLNLVATLLKFNRDAAIIKGEIPADLSNDSIYIVEYHNKKIGIVTYGDDGKTLSKAFCDIENDCDLYICATRTKDSSVEFARKEFYNILWIEKWSITTEHCELNNIDNLQQKTNELQAMGIIDIIDEILWLK